VSEREGGSLERRRSRGPTIVVAAAVFLASGLLLWRAFPANPDASERVWAQGYPSPPPSGYYILLPEEAESIGDFEARVTALTHLPSGTLLDISTTNEGTCCLPVEDSTITFTTQDSSCFGFVGQPPRATSFEVTITAKPDFEPWGVLGPGPSDPPEQPDSVLNALGQRFEHLSGDQVQAQDDGSRWLVSEGTVPWPEPRCGGDPIPQFGGPDCNPNDFQQQLQAYDLNEAIGWVVGTISQGRMCEVWAVMLTPEAAAEHPWPEFSAEWRAWLLEQDFSDVGPTGDSKLRGAPVGDAGGATIVDVLHDGRRIATFEVQPLPSFCKSCNPGTVPFWGVTAWELDPSGSSAGP
jgi:hypothetical protein